MDLKKYFSKYWWGLPALVALVGMLISTLPSMEFSRELNLGFLGLSILGAFGWFTRVKEKPVNKESSINDFKQDPSSEDNLNGQE